MMLAFANKRPNVCSASMNFSISILHEILWILSFKWLSNAAITGSKCKPTVSANIRTVSFAKWIVDELKCIDFMPKSLWI